MTMLPIANVVSKAASPYAAPQPKESKTVAGDNTAPSASLMPTVRQLDAGIQVIDPSVALQKNFTDMPLARVYHPRQAPSAVSSENFLAARAAMNPGFVHNVAQTNSVRISNLYKEAPRFRNDLDLIA
jgi:CO/xanthine dehydrogenase FAD-binding subunit